MTTPQGARVVGSDGQIYIAIAASGPNYGGAVDPATNSNSARCWESLKASLSTGGSNALTPGDIGAPTTTYFDNQLGDLDDKLENEVASLTEKHAADVASFESIYDEKVNDLETKHDDEIDSITTQISNLNDKLVEEIADLTSEHNADIANFETTYDKKISDLTTQHNNDIATVKTQVSSLETKHTSDVSTINTRISNLDTELTTEITNLTNEHDADISNFKTTYDKKIDDLESEHDSDLTSLEAALRQEMGQSDIAGNAGTTTKLQTARTIDGISFDGTADVTHYGSCTTAAGTAAKTVNITNFVLATGAVVRVKFSNANTNANPTLNVSSTGAAAIRYRGSAFTALLANVVYTFVYTGSVWEISGASGFTVGCGLNYADNNLSLALGAGLTCSSSSGIIIDQEWWEANTNATFNVSVQSFSIASLSATNSGLTTTATLALGEANGVGYVVEEGTVRATCAVTLADDTTQLCVWDYAIGPGVYDGDVLTLTSENAVDVGENANVRAYSVIETMVTVNNVTQTV